MKRTLASVAIVVTALSCSQKQAPAPAAPAASANQLAGSVIETMNAGGYTYVRLKTPAGERWAAVRETPLERGENVAVNVELNMNQFESKALGRTFDTIAFGTLTDERPPADVAAQDHMRAPSSDVRVERAPGGKTVAEVWSQRKQLDGQQVVVRGNVVKFLADIMGTNWMHIQDGSASDRTGDLTVTTNETAKIGDVVTVRGIVRADKDFGSGYRYDVILEKARLSR